MRHNQNRRSRGRSRKGPNPLARSYESNGPDVKVRGNAAHVAEKYMSLARDAHASGDVVGAENYLQHAEHYNRIVMAAQAQFQQAQQQFREGGEDSYDDDRQMNGRAPRARFEYNGESRDDDGEDRGDVEGEEDRGFRPAQARQHEGGDRQRGPRDRYERRDRSDQRDGRDRPERSERSERPERGDEPQPEVAQPPAVAEAEAAAPPAEEPVRPPRRRRTRQPRGANAEGGTSEGDDTTPDGAAALAAFPE